MRHPVLSAAELDRIAHASLLIEDAQALLANGDWAIVAAHLQYALDLLRREPMLVADSPAARRIDHASDRAFSDDPDVI